MWGGTELRDTFAREWPQSVSDVEHWSGFCNLLFPLKCHLHFSFYTFLPSLTTAGLDKDMPQHTSAFSLLGHSSRAHGTFCKVINTKARKLIEHQPQEVPYRQHYALPELCQGEFPTTCTKLLEIQFSIHRHVACFFWFGWPFLGMLLRLYLIVFIYHMLLKTAFCSDFLYSQMVLPLCI